jgi:glycosyltransferase involved in cell wall biosynthesis
MYAPLGVDPVFLGEFEPVKRDLIITTGYVAGYGAEAIEEVWNAAERHGIGGIHLGPKSVHGIKREKMPKGWRNAEAISDEELAGYYRRALFVGAMRYFEGFELPAAEGLACGARPIMFNQPAVRHWYGSTAVYLPELTGGELTDLISDAILNRQAVTTEERKFAATQFNWERIATEIWARVGRL